MPGTRKRATYKGTGVVLYQGLCYVLRVTDEEAESDRDPAELVKPSRGEVPRRVENRFLYGGRWFEPLEPDAPVPSETIREKPERLANLSPEFYYQIRAWIALELDPEEIAQRILQLDEAAEFSTSQLARALRRFRVTPESNADSPFVDAVACHLHLIELRQRMRVLEQRVQEATLRGDLEKVKSANVVLRMQRDMAKLYEGSIRHARSLRRTRRR